MTEPEYYKPGEIRYSRQQIEWLIPYLPFLRSGSYPRDPAESGYTEASISKRQIKAKAGFITGAEIAAELDWRISQCGIDGLFLEMSYSQPDDKMFVIQHIATALRVEVSQIERDIHRALNYISGFRRRTRTYSQWKNHKGGKE